MKGYELLLRELRKMEKKWKVSDLMTKEVKTISPDADMSEAIRKMKRHGIHGLVVTDNKRPVGIITTYDALLVMTRGEDGERIPVKDVMSQELINASPEGDILDALEIMLDNQLTKLPVVENKELVGILSATDMLYAFDKLFPKGRPTDAGEYRRIILTIKDVMHKPTIIDPELSVLDAAKIMAEKEIGSVLIIKGDICGILTERDIFKKVVAKGLDSKKIRVSELMSAPCYTIGPDACISDASKLFNKHNIRRLPVVEHGEIIGVVSARDIAKTIAMRRRL